MRFDRKRSLSTKRVVTQRKVRCRNERDRGLSPFDRDRGPDCVGYVAGINACTHRQTTTVDDASAQQHRYLLVKRGRVIHSYRDTAITALIGSAVAETIIVLAIL
jgi:hypothetical protein